jgi:hypothetical protein
MICFVRTLLRMPPRSSSIPALVALLVGASVVSGAAPVGSQRGDDEVVTVSVIPGATAVPPGAWVPVAVVIDLKPKWHLHTNDPKVPEALGSAEDYVKTAISAGPTADGRLRPDVARIQWPAPVMAKVGFGGPPVEYGVFEGRTIAYLPVEVPATAEPGVATLSVALTYQACDDRICLAPVEGKPFTVQIAVDPSAPGFPAAQTYPELFVGFDASRLPAPTQPAAPAGGISTVGIVAIAAVAIGVILGLLFFLKRVL